MKRSPVSSSNIKTIGYKKADKVLEVEFNSGRIYHYFEVPESVYNGLISAESIGKYHVENIKNKYSYSIYDK